MKRYIPVAVLVWASFPCLAQETLFIRGDANADHGVNINDGIDILRSVFLLTEPLVCLDAADANDDGAVGADVLDALTVLSYLFLSAPRLPTPFPVCGRDLTEDALNCGDYPPCAGVDESNPRIHGFGLGENCEGEFLYKTCLDFAWECFGVFDLTLFGTNFAGVDRLVLEDSGGRRQSFLDIRPPGRRGNFEVLSVSLVNARFSVRYPRDTLKAWVQSDRRRSNTAFLAAGPGPESPGFGGPLGPVINGVLIEPDRAAGVARLDYSFYDIPDADCRYGMVFTWSADGGRRFYPARSADHPENDGVDRVSPGTLEAAPPESPFCATGAMRTFVWDARGDSNLSRVDPGEVTVIFRIEARPLCSGRPDPGVLAETPPVTY